MMNRLFTTHDSIHLLLSAVVRYHDWAGIAIRDAKPVCLLLLPLLMIGLNRIPERQPEHAARKRQPRHRAFIEATRN